MSYDNSIEEKLKFFVESGSKFIIETVMNEVPDTGKIFPKTVYYDIPKKGYTAFFRIKGFEGEKRRLEVGVTIGDSGYIDYTSIPLYRTKDEIINYLNDENNVPKLIQIFLNLIDKADESANEYPFHSV